MTSPRQIFFTSDTHFYHKNIIKYCNRPFQDVDHMNDTIIENWNKIVKPHDTVYHLGDFAFGFGQRSMTEKGNLISNLVYKLHGDITLIKGNHDLQSSFLYRCGFKSIHNTLSIAIDPQISLYLEHRPNFNKDLWLYKSQYHLCGHVHEAWKYNGGLANIQGIINVGVDVWNFTPVHIDVIKQVLTKGVNHG